MLHTLSRKPPIIIHIQRSRSPSTVCASPPWRGARPVASLVHWWSSAPDKQPRGESGRTRESVITRLFEVLRQRKTERRLFRSVLSERVDGKQVCHPQKILDFFPAEHQQPFWFNLPHVPSLALIRSDKCNMNNKLQLFRAQRVQSTFPDKTTFSPNEATVFFTEVLLFASNRRSEVLKFLCLMDKHVKNWQRMHPCDLNNNMWSRWETPVFAIGQI